MVVGSDDVIIYHCDVTVDKFIHNKIYFVLIVLGVFNKKKCALLISFLKDNIYYGYMYLYRKY